MSCVGALQNISGGQTTLEDRLRPQQHTSNSNPLMFQSDYYSILGVLPSAEMIVIRAAYRALAQKYHPDKWVGEKSEAHRRMKEINDAYEVLSDEAKRKAYDSKRQKNTDTFGFDDEAMRTAFGDAEEAQSSDWELAVEYYSDLPELYRRLKRTSDTASIAD
jgi:curved DNA-binding protein CbpA